MTETTYSPIAAFQALLATEPLQEEVTVAETENAKKASSALATVINFILTDAFNLTEEENMWVSYHLNTILSPVDALHPRIVLAAVKREIDSNEYSDKLFHRNWQDSGYVDRVNGVRYASIEDWVEAISEIVLICYPDLRPILQTSIISSIYGVMTELGLSADVKKSRGSVYLPTAIRTILGVRE